MLKVDQIHRIKLITINPVSDPLWEFYRSPIVHNLQLPKLFKKTTRQVRRLQHNLPLTAELIQSNSNKEKTDMQESGHKEASLPK